MGPCGFAIEVRRPDGELVDAAAASVSKCVEDGLLRSVQEGHLPNDGTLPPLRLVPEWDETQRPAITALHLRIGDGPPRSYGKEVFEVEAGALVRRLLHERRLAEGEPLHWRVIAREEAQGAPPARVTRRPFPLEPAELPEVPRGASEIRFEASLLRRLHARILRSGELEDAELLLGRQLFDARRKALQLWIGSALPLAAGRGGRSNLHFAFDPGSLVAARRAAAARDDGTRPAGWHHNHSPCPGCPHQPDCRVDWVFFSDADREVHTSAFASPLMVALVGGKVGHLPARRPGFRLYGWRGARLVELPFRVEGAGAETWSDREGSFQEEER